MFWRFMDEELSRVKEIASDWEAYMEFWTNRGHDEGLAMPNYMFEEQAERFSLYFIDVFYEDFVTNAQTLAELDGVTLRFLSDDLAPFDSRASKRQYSQSK